ncbi:curli-like amyloid fiber formation chaperone CsgH [Devosia rhodophyticola]|uniref:Curli-like amyloid fiber formation chaperone CsgH n=1 Tax=Devosia rhodophyticola TaxID=3026423 RepID=A0ABY7Z038_9HYPH|nr:curli-like amyloid fiber formation chaperone CsgH [Devosia rhodophyticola]WDR06993.1 curli-like amyloid fiber formation chaperone CsgH [Devosia rhodophyticola]
MTKFNTRLALPALAGMAILGFAVTSGQADTANADHLRCGLISDANNGSVAMEARLLSPTDLSGTYRLSIVSSGPSGRSNINQGGGFSVRANEDVVLGRVSLNANASTKVDFEISANGATIDCTADANKLR